MFLAYASPKGRALVDRELYLPRSWTGDEARLGGARVPGDRRFRTKPQLLQAMIERAVAAGVPFRWVTADEGYGDNGPLRAYLEKTKFPTCWRSPATTCSGGMAVFVEDAAEPVSSADIEVCEPLGIGNRSR